MVTREGLEPPTFWFVAKRSNPTELPGRVVVDKEYIITAVIHCQMFFENFFYFLELWDWREETGEFLERAGDFS